MMSQKQMIPTSWYAKDQIMSNWWNCYGSSVAVSGIDFFIIILITMFADVEAKATFLYGSVIALGMWSIMGMLRRGRWKRSRQEILLRNKIDHELSLKLKEGLRIFATTKSSAFPITEKAVEGDWRPFRVEHFLSNSLRGGFLGEGKISMSFMAGFAKGHIKGTSDGVAIPNLLDTSTILFLKGATGGATLRVLIPSPKVTRDLFSGTIKQWLNRVEDYTHIRRVLDDFVMGDTNLLEPISHPQLIDSLDATIELSSKERPSVIVRGEKVQDGVVLATELEINGERSVFMPSGFFRELASKVMPLLDQAQSPTMLATVQ